MDEQHPKLTAARDPFDAGAVIGIAMRARAAQDDGRYCECADPLVVGRDLLCGACLLNNRDQERAAVRWLVDAHVFVPSERESLRWIGWCDRCTNPEDAPRHHGVPGVGRTSWDEQVVGGSTQEAT